MIGIGGGIGIDPPSVTASCGTPSTNCTLPQRIAVVNSYLATRPGVVGYVLRDRVTGAAYRNANASRPIYTASTIKLAMVADLLTRARLRTVRLSAADRQAMVAMLRNSDNAAADSLWTRYGGPGGVFNANCPRYGMSGVQPRQSPPHGGTQVCTTDDLDRLMNYVLTNLGATDTAAVVAEMQRVESGQRWGVWSAGPQMTPGAKNGWSPEEGGWVVNSVGFAGPNQRYTLAVMNALGGQGGYEDGVTTTTRVSEILLKPGG